MRARLTFLLALTLLSSPVLRACAQRPCIRVREAVVCDTTAILSARARTRVLRAATRLARVRCGAVTVVIGAVPVSPDANSARAGCEVRVHPPRVAGHVLPKDDCAAAELRLAMRLTSGWSQDDALVETLRLLRGATPRPLPRPHPPPPGDFRRTSEAARAVVLVGAALVALGALLAAVLRARNSGAPRWERARRYLARLDDARARARALRFGAAACPICLDSLAPPSVSRASRTVSTRRTSARRVRLDSNSSSSSSSAESAATTRRTLPCGHAFHEQCLLRWVSGAARNCAACPVCRAPARAAADAAPRCARTAVTLVSDNMRQARPRATYALVEDSATPHSVDEMGGGAPSDAWSHDAAGAVDTHQVAYELVSDVTPTVYSSEPDSTQ